MRQGGMRQTTENLGTAMVANVGRTWSRPTSGIAAPIRPLPVSLHRSDHGLRTSYRFTSRDVPTDL